MVGLMKMLKMRLGEVMIVQLGVQHYGILSPLSIISAWVMNRMRGKILPSFEVVLHLSISFLIILPISLLGHLPRSLNYPSLVLRYRMFLSSLMSEDMIALIYGC